MLTTEQAIRIGRLQERIYRCVEDELNSDGGHKSYEGAMDITMSLPNIFNRADSPQWMIEVHAYVLSTINGRHKSWTGKTLEEALGAAENGIDEICSPYEMERFSRAIDAMCDNDCEVSGGKTYGPNRHEESGMPF